VHADDGCVSKEARAAVHNRATAASDGYVQYPLAPAVCGVLSGPLQHAALTRTSTRRVRGGELARGVGCGTLVHRGLSTTHFLPGCLLHWCAGAAVACRPRCRGLVVLTASRCGDARAQPSSAARALSTASTLTSVDSSPPIYCRFVRHPQLRVATSNLPLTSHSQARTRAQQRLMEREWAE
jgi:hypothetical protein